MSYRTLVIAPQTDLEYSSDEVMAVVNALGARLLQGKRATITGLVDILNEGWEIVWLCTHGDETGAYLSDGVVKTSELTALVRSTGASLTVMNTCSSYPIANEMHDEIGGTFVCTVKVVPDREAFLTGTIFARQLAKGLSFYEAYQLAKPGQNSTYTFIGDRGVSMPSQGGDRFGSQRNSGQMPDADTLARMVRTVEDIAVVVLGMPNVDVPPLKDVIREVRTQLRSVQDELRQVANRLDKIEERQKLRNLWMGAMFAIILFLLATVAVMARFFY